MRGISKYLSDTSKHISSIALGSPCSPLIKIIDEKKGKNKGRQKIGRKERGGRGKKKEERKKGNRRKEEGEKEKSEGKEYTFGSV